MFDPASWQTAAPSVQSGATGDVQARVPMARLTATTERTKRSFFMEWVLAER